MFSGIIVALSLLTLLAGLTALRMAKPASPNATLLTDLLETQQDGHSSSGNKKRPASLCRRDADAIE